MNATDPRVRIRRLREVYKFYLLADAADDNYDINLNFLGRKLQALEQRLAKLMHDLEWLEHGLHEATDFSPIILDVEDCWTPPPN